MEIDKSIHQYMQIHNNIRYIIYVMFYYRVDLHIWILHIDMHSHTTYVIHITQKILQNTSNSHRGERYIEMYRPSIYKYLKIEWLLGGMGPYCEGRERGKWPVERG